MTERGSAEKGRGQADSAYSPSIDASPSALLKRLRGEVGVTPWSTLKPHAQRGALFWVHPPVELAEVGVAVAEDDVGRVGVWIESGALERSTSEPPLDAVAYYFLIVQPFVLARPHLIEESSEESSEDPLS